MKLSVVAILSTSLLLAACAGADSSAAPGSSTSGASTTATPVEAAGPIEHRVGPIPATEHVDCTSESGALAVGEQVALVGFDDRPTLLQRAPDPTAPLLVVFHGQRGCIEGLQSDTDLDELAPPAGVSVLWLSGAALPERSWNVNDRCCDPASDAGVQELPYIEAALAAGLAAGITPTSVIAVGVSNGGAMAVAAACIFPHLFQGAVSVAGWAPIPCARSPLSLLVAGGTADEVIGVDTPAVVAALWRTEVVECLAAPLIETVGAATVSTWVGCSGGTVVRHARLDGVTHVWPKFDFYDMDVEIIRFARGEFS